MTEGEIEYCKACLEGKCEEHQWFGRPKTEKEVLIANLKQLLDILPPLIEKVYLVQTILQDPEDRFFTNGEIEFCTGGFAAHKKEDYYIPVDSYDACAKGVIDFTIDIVVLITRHNPIDLKIYDDCLAENPIHSVGLIKEDDFLHCEMIRDYNRIVKFATRRLQQFIKELERGALK